VLRCGKLAPDDSAGATGAAARESVAPATASAAAVANHPRRGGGGGGGGSTETALRSSRSGDDVVGDCPTNERRVVIAVVSAVDAAHTACSSPTTPPDLQLTYKTSTDLQNLPRSS